MTRMTFDFSMALGGVVTASNVSTEEPLGDGGILSSEWVYPGGGGYRSTITRSSWAGSPNPGKYR